MPQTASAVTFAQNLSMRDRDGLLREMLDKQPSIDLNVRTSCAACGEEVPLGIAWGTIFRA